MAIVRTKAKEEQRQGLRQRLPLRVAAQRRREEPGHAGAGAGGAAGGAGPAAGDPVRVLARGLRPGRRRARQRPHERRGGARLPPTAAPISRRPQSSSRGRATARLFFVVVVSSKRESAREAAAAAECGADGRGEAASARLERGEPGRRAGAGLRGAARARRGGAPCRAAAAVQEPRRGLVQGRPRQSVLRDGDARGGRQPAGADRRRDRALEEGLPGRPRGAHGVVVAPDGRPRGSPRHRRPRHRRRRAVALPLGGPRSRAQNPPVLRRARALPLPLDLRHGRLAAAAPRHGRLQGPRRKELRGLPHVGGRRGGRLPEVGLAKEEVADAGGGDGCVGRGVSGRRGVGAGRAAVRQAGAAGAGPGAGPERSQDRDRGARLDGGPVGGAGAAESGQDEGGTARRRAAAHLSPAARRVAQQSPARGLFAARLLRPESAVGVLRGGARRAAAVRGAGRGVGVDAAGRPRGEPQERQRAPRRAGRGLGALRARRDRRHARRVRRSRLDARLRPARAQTDHRRLRAHGRRVPQQPRDPRAAEEARLGGPGRAAAAVAGRGEPARGRRGRGPRGRRGGAALGSPDAPRPRRR
mmetsp:Transcript_29162/g.89197  ORF Transcript_29162/g.89197 Transcript_29162/m.89197 type:complete len:586 (-) Transcript_29162:614-2371(-)